MNNYSKVMIVLLVGGTSSVMFGGIWDKAKGAAKSTGSAIGGAASSVGGAVADAGKAVVNALHAEIKISDDKVFNAQCKNWKWTALNEIEASCFCRKSKNPSWKTVKTTPILPPQTPGSFYYIYTEDKHGNNPRLDALIETQFTARSRMNKQGEQPGLSHIRD
jgi:hypothetical protein